MTRAVYDQLMDVKTQIEEYDKAVEAAELPHGGIRYNGTIFRPTQLWQQSVRPARAQLNIGWLANIRDQPRHEAIDQAVRGLRRVLVHLSASTTANGLPDPDPGTPVLLRNVQARRRDAVEIAEWVLDDLKTSGSPVARGLENIDQSVSGIDQSVSGIDQSVSGIGQSVSAITAYPLLTDGAASSGGSGGDGPTSGQLQLVVDATVRDVIGRLPRYTDARAFEAALTSSFGIQDNEGIRIVTWRPRSYAGSAGLGASVTGIQASVYARALGAREAVVPLLQGLRPLLPDFDQQEVEAARNVVRAELDALVEELGTDGGPRQARVDQLFDVLFNQTTTGPSGPVNGGMVGYLGYVYGFADQQGMATSSQVNTIEEEQDYSSFVLLEDHLRTVQQSWQSFIGQGAQDLGTSLYLLSRVLQVVAESVDEIESALDSVFVGDAERGIIRFDTTSSGEMRVNQLLSWIRSFAATEAPTLIADSGRRGLGPIVDTATRLRALNDDLVSEIANDPELPDGMRHPRVHFPLHELRGYLGQVAVLAQRAK
jgi:hypothetical protein